MGVDQCAYASKRGVKKIELACWRKHPNLEGFMAQLYEDKGGTKIFNCVKLRLDGHDLDSLETCIEAGELPETAGFFFGSGSDDDYREEDLQFIYKARQYLSEGYNITYTSWW